MIITEINFFEAFPNYIQSVNKQPYGYATAHLNRLLHYTAFPKTNLKQPLTEIALISLVFMERTTSYNFKYYDVHKNRLLLNI